MSPAHSRAARAIIIGAGQAGLAMADALGREGVATPEIRIIDSSPDDETSWHRRWHSLILFTPARYSSLPGLAMPGDQDRYPRADEVADYLRHYRARLGVATEWNTRATKVSYDEHGHGLVVSTRRGDFAGRNVVLATGPYDRPRVPGFAHKLSVPALHAAQYTHPKQLPAGRVLVVGAGNTGVQLARELATTREVFLARGAPLPTLQPRYFGIELFRLLSATGVLRFSPPRVIRRWLAHREVIIGEGVEQLRGLGVKILPRAVSAEGDEIVAADGTRVSVDAVLWATGYEPGFELLPPTDRDRDLQGGGMTSMRGLFVLGSPWLRSRGSALITGVAKDASRIARWIAKRP